MSSKAIGSALLVAGVLIFLTALSADSLGLGAHPGLGIKQISGAVVGVIFAALGMVRLRDRG